MTASLPIDRVLTDHRLLGAELGDAASWSTWMTVLKAAFALPLDDEERVVFAAVAGGRTPPSKRVRELWCIVGRRGGKSRIAAALAVYFALFIPHRLSGGEHAKVLVLAASMDQAKVVFDYVSAFLNATAPLRKEIVRTTRNEIRLKNGITIAIHANSYRSVRGRTLAACIFDEVSFWRDDTTATPDTETYTAVLPSLITTNGMLVGISSPYRRVGLMYARHKRYFGVASDDTLVVQGSTLTFNRTLDADAIAAQREADPTAARSEWDAQFRTDLSGFLDDELIEQAVDRTRPLELPWRPGKFYKAYCDSAGGAQGGDAYCIAISHREGGVYVIDAIRGRYGPFDPEQVTAEFAQLCKEYHCTSVTEDLYAREWTASAWRKQSIAYTPSTLSASDTYLEVLPLFTRAAVRLPDHPVLLRELRLLERMPTRMGKDQVTHPRNVHDDYSNVCCGALYSLANAVGAYQDLLGKAFGEDEPQEVVLRQRQDAERRHAALMARYGGPIAL